jgi:hypothetical protein
MSGSSVIDGIDSDLADAWCGDATSVVEFLLDRSSMRPACWKSASTGPAR